VGKNENFLWIVLEGGIWNVFLNVSFYGWDLVPIV